MGRVVGMGVLAAAPSVLGQWIQTPLVSSAAAAKGIYGGEGAQRIYSLHISRDGDVLLFGTDAGGVWLSTNGGARVEPTHRGLKAKGAWAVAIDPNHSSRFLLTAMKDSGTQRGLFLSIDRGQSWAQVLTNNAGGGPPWQIAYDPSSSDGSKSLRAYWSPGTGAGFWRTTNGGLSWEQVQAVSTYAGANVAVHPTSGRVYLAGPNGFFYSPDNGASFTRTFTGTVTGLAVTPAAPNLVAICSGTSVYMSTDSGDTFVSKASMARATFNLQISPATTNRMVLSTAAAAGWYEHYYSWNGGSTWTLATNYLDPDLINWDPTDVCGRFALHPTQTNTVFSVSGDFVTVSTNGGAGYVWNNNGYAAVAVRDVSFNQTNPNLVVMACQDYEGGFSTNGGTNWFWRTRQGGPHSLGGYAFSSTRFFIDRSTNWSGPYFSILLTTNGGASYTSKGTYSANKGWAYGNPVDPNGAFWNSRRTTDAGDTWPAMTGVNFVCTHNPTGQKELYGVSSQTVVVSTNQGVNWSAVCSLAYTITQVAYDQTNNRLYITADDQSTGKLYQYQNGVLSNLTSRLPVDPFLGTACAQCVAVDPVDPRIVYVGRQSDTYAVGHVVMRSTNSAVDWSVLSLQPGQAGLDGGGIGALRLRVNPGTRQLWVLTDCNGIWRYPAPGGAAPPAPAVVSVTANDATATEHTPVNDLGVFRISRDTTAATNLTVYYTTNGSTATMGSDFTNLTGSVTIFAGATYADVIISPIDDATAESTETVVLSLSANAAYSVGSPATATINLVDNDSAVTLPTVTLSATDSSAVEPGPANTGTFQVSRGAGAATNLAVYFSIGGGAVNGADYATIASPVTIKAGDIATNIMITPLADGAVETNETVILTLTANAGYQVGSPSSGTVYLTNIDLAAGSTVTETFDSAASLTNHGWTGVGNSAGGNNFGFSNTDHTGGSSGAGEAGGTLARSTNVSFYADTTLGTTFDLSSALHGDGELAITGNSGMSHPITIGFFRSADGGTAGRKNTLGLTIAEPNTNFTYRARASVTLSDGTSVESSAILYLTNGNSTYRFRFDYDPAAGGYGTVTLSFTNGAGTYLGSVAKALSSAQRATGATFDSFGLQTGGLASPSAAATVNLYLDNATYSALQQNFGLAATGFNAWKQAQFGNSSTNPAVAGDLADPDTDGLCNLVEYGLGLNPWQANVPDPICSRITDGRLVLTYTRPSAPPADLAYTHELSGALDVWSAATNVEITPNLDGTETVRVTDSIPASQAARRFLRLKISRTY
jgi:hypothetical protein